MKKLMRYIFPLILIGVLVFLFLVNMNVANKNSHELLELGKINNTYHRANSCIITMEPSQRTTEFKNSCYDRAEKITGVKVERFNVK